MKYMAPLYPYYFPPGYNNNYSSGKYYELSIETRRIASDEGVMARWSVLPETYNAVVDADCRKAAQSFLRA